MADRPDILTNILAGMQEQPEGDGVVYDTSNVLGRMRQPNPVSAALNTLASYLPVDDREENRRGPDEPWVNWWARTNLDSGGATALSGMLRSGLGTAANWLDGSPEIGPDTLAPLGAAGVGAAAARHAAPHPSPSAESFVDKVARWGKAAALHQRNEAKRGNADGFPAGLGAFGLSTAAALGGWPVAGATGMILTHPRSVLMSPHFDDVSNIAKYLRDVELREARKQPTPDNAGTTLYADSSRASIPGTVVNAVEQSRFKTPEASAGPLEKVTPAKGQDSDAGVTFSGGEARSMPSLSSELSSLPRIPNPIKAYHGSPHDFDKFDLSKIGTGEGAQAYGHGLYFAENEGVAKMYRDGLGGSGLRVGGEAMDIPTGGPGYRAHLYLKEAKGDVDAALKMLGQDKEAANVLRYWESEGLDFKPPRMYEVALHATPEQFLDWDKPLSGQSQAARAALERVYADARSKAGYPVPLTPGAEMEAHLRSLGNALGHAKQVKEGVHPDFIPLRPDHAAAADALREAGIPGIRYLDQGSRTGSTTGRLDGKPLASNDLTGHSAVSMLNDLGSPQEAIAALRQAAKNARHPDEVRQAAQAAQLIEDGRITIDPRGGTSNYVVWTPEIIELLKKYGIAAPVAAPTLAGMLQENKETP